MAEHYVVTLKLPSVHLQALDFTDTKVLELKPVKKKPASKRKTEDGKSRPTSASPAPTPTVNADPMLGSLPRSLKSAPLPNMSGLVLDKTPCRKWQWKPLVIKTFTGYDCNFVGWHSDFTENEQKNRTEKKDTEVVVKPRNQKLTLTLKGKESSDDESEEEPRSEPEMPEMSSDPVDF